MNIINYLIKVYFLAPHQTRQSTLKRDGEHSEEKVNYAIVYQAILHLLLSTGFLVIILATPTTR